MADLPIRNRYKAYKEGTESLVRWITRTASRYSNAADFLHTLVRPGCSAITLTTRDLVTLTKLVVANVAVDIPENILRIMQGVVAEREVCANWYKDQGMNGESTASDKTHAYFIGTLHEIYHLLDSARASQKTECPPLPRETLIQSVPSAFNNLFQHLKVEEPVANPLGTTTGTFEGFTTADKLTFRLEKEKDDKAFAIWCLLGDFSAVREHITHVWQDYEAGKKSLLAAGVITDTAFGLMRHANNDFANGNGDVATYPAMLAFLEEEMLVPVNGETTDRVSMEDESTNDETTEDEEPRKMTGRRRVFTGHDQDTLLCREAGQLFETLTDTFRGDATDTASSITSKESPLGVFGDTLLKLAPSIQQMAHEDPTTPEKGYDHRLSADEFVSALMKLARNDKSSRVPIWLVAAGQLYMEIHTVLHGEMSCGVQGFSSYLQRIQPLAKRAKTISADDPYRMQHEFFEKFEYGGFAEHFDVTKELDQIAKSQCWDFAFPKCAAIVAHFLPIYPCSLGYRIRFVMQFYTMQYLSNGMIVLPMAHLYKAGQKYGLVKSAWKDMDFILTNHVAHKYSRTGTQPIVAEPNKRADAFGMATLFRAALGVPTVDLNKPTRPRLPAYPRTEWRCITFKSELIQAMEEVYRGVVHLKSTDREYINIVLRRLSDAESKGKKKGRKITKYTLVELLETYERHIKANEPALTFDYITFVDVCAREIGNLVILHNPRSRKLLESPPWDFVDCMLWSAADVVQKLKNSSPEELDHALMRTRFGRTVTDLGSMIEKIGDKCSNYL
jgi:hypothetical protein